MLWLNDTPFLPYRIPEQPEPAPVKVNGKEYDYYKMTQKMRSMERNIRALKKELAAREALKLPRTEVKAKISQKTREYEEFCKKCKVPERTTNLRVDGSAADVTKTKAYKVYEELKNDVLAPKIADKMIQKAYDDFGKVLLKSKGNKKLVNNMLIYQDTTEWQYDNSLASPFAYRPSVDAIVYNPKANNYELYDMDYVQSHELAHRMDIKEYHSWDNAKFHEAIASSKQSVYDNIMEIESLVKQDGAYRYDMAFSDIISALTDGELNDILTATHDDAYWRVTRMKSMEIFANLYSIEVNGYSSKNVLKKLFPELLEAFERML